MASTIAPSPLTGIFASTGLLVSSPCCQHTLGIAALRITNRRIGTRVAFLRGNHDTISASGQCIVSQWKFSSVSFSSRSSATDSACETPTPSISRKRNSSRSIGPDSISWDTRMDGVIDIRSTSDGTERNVDDESGNRTSKGTSVLELIEGRISSIDQWDGGGSNVDMVVSESIARIQIESKYEFGAIAGKSPSSHIFVLTCQQRSAVYRATTSSNCCSCRT